MDIQNDLQLTYTFYSDEMNIDDTYTSKYDLTKAGTTPIQLSVFFISFILKIGLMTPDTVEKIFRVKLHNSDTHEDSSVDQGEIPLDDLDFDFDKKEKEKNSESKNIADLFIDKKNIGKDISKIVNDRKNLESFKKQINSNDELLKEVFELFLEDTIE